MRYLILSDQHGNFDATAAVMRKVRRKSFDAHVMLGDLVGYGASPNEVVEAVRALGPGVHVVRGNHDKVIAGLEDGRDFNPVAIRSALWSRDRLSTVNRRFLQEMPKGPTEVDGFTICHGAPTDEDRYLLSVADAIDVFEQTRDQVCFFGHTHQQLAFLLSPAGELSVKRFRGSSGRFSIREGWRYLINPGSVGQPRDRDPRAGYMIYDSASRVVSWYRIAYPIERAQKKIVRAGLPALLAERLAYGV